MSGGNTCAVAICRNYSLKVKKSQENVRFFQFPKDIIIQKQWTQKCYRKDKFKPENSRICSRHFNRQDFEDDMKARLLNTIPKKLKSSAVPSLYLLPVSDAQILSKARRHERALAKEQTDFVMTLVCKDPMKEQILETLPSASQESAHILSKARRDECALAKEQTDIVMTLVSKDPIKEQLLETLPPVSQESTQTLSNGRRDERALAKEQTDFVMTLVSKDPIKEKLLETSPSASQENYCNILKRHRDTITKENEFLKKSLQEARNEITYLKNKVLELENKIKSA